MSTGAEFTAGRLMERTFAIWLANLVPFTILALILYSPILLYMAVVGLGGAGGMAGAVMPLVQVGGALILGNALVGAVVYGVFQQLRGQHADPGSCLSVGLARLFPVLGVAILVGLATFGGLMACVVPGIIVTCMLWVAVPVSVVEQPGVIDSLRRSSQLTEGARWSILAVALALGFLVLMVQVVAQIAVTVAGMSAVLGQIVTLLLALPFTTLPAVAPAVAYHDLRVMKEGIGIEDLARVFD